MSTIQSARHDIDADAYGHDVEFRVLGPVEYVGGDAAEPLGSPKQRAVLALLLKDAAQVVSADRLIQGVWGDEASDANRRSLHTYISNLRSILGGRIERAGSGYRIDVAREDVDAHLFEQLTDEAQATLTANPARASQALRTALALWRGRPYADLADTPGLRNEIRRLEERRLTAVESRIDADLAAGRHQAIIGELGALAEEHPLREGLRGRHMIALYRDGRQAEALRAYQRTREYLAEELGVEPSLELQKIEDSILRHDPALMSSQDVRTQDLSFLYTDIEGSTILWETRPEAMRDALVVHDQILTETIEASGGRVFKHTGDGMLAAFDSAAEAAAAAADTQRLLNAGQWGSIGRLSVRMAIDAGEVEARGGDYFGPPLNRGARLMDAAHGGQIVLSSAAHERLIQHAGLHFKNLGEYRFKGLGTPQTVFQLVDPDLPADFPDLRVNAASSEAERHFGDSIRGYEIRERIGSGRFAVVYRAYQASVGREVAVKVIRPEYANHPGFVRRFESEARMVARLEHPHIVSLYDFWRDPQGAYLVMPWLSGRSLVGAPFGAMSESRVLPIIQQIGSALAYAHRQGVIHRDIKPANLLLDADGNAYLADFGIAVRSLEPATAAPSASQVYRAPEDTAGGAIDQRTDVYSLAAVAAELLTGTAPGVVDHARLPDSVASVVDRAMNASPQDRYGSVEEFVEAFAAAVGRPMESVERISVVVRNPYKGLAAFGEADAADFFGREAELAALLELVDAHRLTTVVGPSGSGKSSLVRAGFVPALRQGRLAGSRDWLIVAAIPGAHPFDELATALLDVATEGLGDLAAELRSDTRGLMRASKRLTRELDTELVIVIDQFEELYSLVNGEDTRSRFVESLVEATQDPHSRLRVISTIRADFFDQPLLHDRFGAIVSSAHLTLSVPGPEALEKAIVEPARRAGLVLEDGLAHQIVRDVRDEPGGLPLMQYALTALTDHASTGELTLADYQAVGGVTGALTAQATAVFDALDAQARNVTQAMFLRLVSVSEDADDVRRRVRRAELESSSADPLATERALDAFGAARLLTFDSDPVTRGPTVEVAHEALLREWILLRSWITDRREVLLARRRLDLAIEEWLQTGKRPEALPIGARLDRFERIADDGTLRLSAVEREFLDAALARRTQERRRSVRARRSIMAGFASAAIIATAFGVQADRNATEAQLAAESEVTSRIASDAPIVFETNPRLGLLLAVEAYNRDRNPVTLGALQRVLVGSRGFLGYVGPNETYRDLAWIDDATILAAHDNGLDLVGVDNSTTQLGFPGGVEAMAIDSAHRLAAVATATSVTLLDLPTGSATGVELPHQHVQSIAFSPRGDLVATGDGKGMVALWDTSTGARRAAPINAHPETTFEEFGVSRDEYRGPLSHMTETFRIGVAELSFDTSGQWLATAGMVALRVWDVETGALIDETRLSHIEGDDRRPTAALELDLRRPPEPTRIGTNGQILEWIPGAGAEPTLIRDFGNVSGIGLTETLTDVIITDDIALFAPQGGRMVGGTISGGDDLLRWDSQLGGQAQIALSANGQRIAQSGTGGIAVWSLRQDGPISISFEDIDGDEIMVGRDGLIVVNWVDAPTRLFEVENGGLSEVPVTPSSPWAWLWLNGDDLYGARDFNALHEIARLSYPTLEPVVDVTLDSGNSAFAFHTVGGIMAAGGVGEAVELFDIDSGRRLAVFDEPTAAIGSIAISPDERFLAAADIEGAAWVWDLETGEPVEPAPLSAGGGQVMLLKYHPGGEYLVTISESGTIVLRDAETLQPVGRPLEGTTGVSTNLSFGPFFQDNGRYMITTIDGPGRLWDLETRVQVGGTFPNAGGLATASTDGRWLATFTDSDLVVWDLDTATWVEKACRAAGRNLTEDEWSQFVSTSTPPRATCPMWDTEASMQEGAP